jgi:hypothetical protein
MAARDIKPAVPRLWLFRFAGAVWGGVGLGLCAVAGTWLGPLAPGKAGLLAGLGLCLAAGMHAGVFSRVRDRNIERIQELPESACLFAFQAWRSYFLVVFMVALGIALRHSQLPRPDLAVLYIMIGGGLAMSSSRYFIVR